MTGYYNIKKKSGSKLTILILMLLNSVTLDIYDNQYIAALKVASGVSSSKYSQ